jgi:polysaccharide pyruvyl transferase WcaK-like protein
VGDLKSPAARWLLRRIVRLQDLFLVRDNAAVAQGAAAGVVVRPTGDLVFSEAPSFAVRDANPHTIALTVVPPAFPTGEARAQAAAELAAAVRTWRARGRRVAFLVFQRSGVTPGDRVLFDLVAEHLGEPIGEVRILDPSRTSIEAAFADVAVVCGMRFHALVLAALVGVPFVGLAHDNKIEDICRRFGMPALSAFSFRCEDLVSAVERVAGRPPQPDLVARCIAAAAENSLLLKSVAS